MQHPPPDVSHALADVIALGMLAFFCVLVAGAIRMGAGSDNGDAKAGDDDDDDGLWDAGLDGPGGRK